MPNFLNASNEGIQITGEKVYVSGLREVKLEHDNFFDITLYYDSGLTNVIPEGLYTKDEYDSDFKGFNKLELESAIYSSYTFIYATYKSKGDYVDADDMNSKLDKIESHECGETLVIYRAVELKNDKLWYPNLLMDSEVKKILGITLESGVINKKAKVLTYGNITNPAWNWNVDLPIYVNANGVLSQSAPFEGISYVIAMPVSPISIRMIGYVDTRNPSNIIQDETHRFVTDTEKATWSAKQDDLGFTPEDVVNKVTSFQEVPDDTHYPTEKLVKDSLDTKSDTTHNHDEDYEPKNENIQSHVNTVSGNPHNVTLAELGIENIDNTADLDKPISTATQNALNLKEDSLGNPTTDGEVLTSLTDGTRSWKKSSGIERKTAAEWTTANPILALNDIGFETDTFRMKIGDGVSTWYELGYTPEIDEIPVQNELNRSVASGWIYSHSSNVNAHHARYTDDEARFAAVRNTMALGATTTAPSEDVVKKALALKEGVLEAERKRKITAGTGDPSGGDDGDLYVKFQS